MNHIRDKSVSQVFTNVATVTQDATNAVVNVSSDVANKTVAATKSVGSTIGSGVSSAVTATANASSALVRAKFWRELYYNWQLTLVVHLVRKKES